MAIVYILTQFIGGVFGFWLLEVLTPTKIFAQSAGVYGVCQTFPNENVGAMDAIIIEYISTMFWISMFCATWDPRNRSQQNSMPLKFGLAITILSVIFVSVFYVLILKRDVKFWVREHNEGNLVVFRFKIKW